MANRSDDLHFTELRCMTCSQIIGYANTRYRYKNEYLCGHCYIDKIKVIFTQ